MPESSRKQSQPFEKKPSRMKKSSIKMSKMKNSLPANRCRKLRQMQILSRNYRMMSSTRFSINLKLHQKSKSHQREPGKHNPRTKKIPTHNNRTEKTITQKKVKLRVESSNPKSKTSIPAAGSFLQLMQKAKGSTRYTTTRR